MATFDWAPDARDQLCDLAADDFDRNVLHIVVQATKAAAPIDSGRMRDNILARRTGRGLATTWEIVARALSDGGYNYPLTVIKGRGSIVAAPGKVLRFIDKTTRQVIYRKRVGPARGNNFMAEGFRRAGLRQVRTLE